MQLRQTLIALSEVFIDIGIIRKYSQLGIGRRVNLCVLLRLVIDHALLIFNQRLDCITDAIILDGERLPLFLNVYLLKKHS